MKKIFILILLLIFTLPAFAQYKAIPQKYSKEYKEKIEHTIETQIPISKTKIDNVFYEVEQEQDKYEKENIIEYGIDGVLFDLYSKLINITEEYIGDNKIYIEEGDMSSLLYEVLILYFKDNKINLSDLRLIIRYAQKKTKRVGKEI